MTSQRSRCLDHLLSSTAATMPAMTTASLDQFHDQWIDGLDFCRMVYARFEEVRTSDEGVDKLRARQRPEKKLLEELLPICRYIQTYYGPGLYISVRWVDGNQAYDAQVRVFGAVVQAGGWPMNGHLEVTQALHAKEHLMRELLRREGGGFSIDGLSVGKDEDGNRKIESVVTSYSNQSYIDDFAAILLNAIQAKVDKMAEGKYPSDTTLIVDCTLHTVFLRDEWDKLIEIVKARVPRSHGFIRIAVYANSSEHAAVL